MEEPGMEPCALPVPAEPLSKDAAEPRWGGGGGFPTSGVPTQGMCQVGRKTPAGSPWSPFPSAPAWGCRRWGRRRREGGERPGRSRCKSLTGTRRRGMRRVINRGLAGGLAVGSGCLGFFFLNFFFNQGILLHIKSEQGSEGAESRRGGGRRTRRARDRGCFFLFFSNFSWLLHPLESLRVIGKEPPTP